MGTQIQSWTKSLAPTSALFTGFNETSWSALPAIPTTGGHSFLKNLTRVKGSETSLLQRAERQDGMAYIRAGAIVYCLNRS